MAGLSNGGSEDDDDTIVVDFRTAFQGSVFEKFHVSPVQMARLDTSCCCSDVNLFYDFIIPSGSARRMMESVDAFAQKFAEHCNKVPGGSSSDTAVLGNLVRKFAMEFLRGSIRGTRMSESEFTDYIVGRDDGDYVALCEFELFDLIRVDDSPDHYGYEVVKAYFCTLFLRYCLSNSYPQLENEECFARWGRDVKCERDETLAGKIYDYFEKENRLINYYMDFEPFNSVVLEEGVKGFLVDFDLVGRDGHQSYPLRMLMFDDERWFAHIRERDTGALIAKVRAKFEDEQLDLREEHVEEVTVVAQQLIDRGYQPHGDVPTTVRLWCDLLDILVDDEYDDEDLENSPRVLGSVQSSPRVLGSVQSLLNASYMAGKLRHTSQSEVAWLIPVAASLTKIYQDYDFRHHCNAREYGLRLSTIADVKQHQCRHFMRLFRGSMWDQLPEELVLRIIDFLPRRRLMRVPPPKYGPWEESEYL
ncbi:hypothetical protein CBR_g37421 [Chara braunii]|uniref:Uncharacterized protein n=1 Tax=Chara braunii TaxID=69332 RepID=A0A388LMR9_CHABU|nr:hypothetical protein CBR_g37421 [Chara braunii]|eukprot:GBG83617.1 hypothetical protein CBR_g37421 [Chara braunii]